MDCWVRWGSHRRDFRVSRRQIVKTNRTRAPRGNCEQRVLSACKHEMGAYGDRVDRRRRVDTWGFAPVVASYNLGS
jgi:hypothetical protein